mmetsp:Transcript_6760/g.15406  ORF Transcript_6760/g.15406 Transcript_6760/m.15406 type:complete len:93 (+) Transcript_6760:243-521(+)
MVISFNRWYISLKHINPKVDLFVFFNYSSVDTPQQPAPLKAAAAASKPLAPSASSKPSRPSAPAILPPCVPPTAYSAVLHNSSVVSKLDSHT